MVRAVSASHSSHRLSRLSRFLLLAIILCVLFSLVFLDLLKRLGFAFIAPTVASVAFVLVLVVFDVGLLIVSCIDLY